MKADETIIQQFKNQIIELKQENENFCKQQSLFTKALNSIAEHIVSENNTENILETALGILSETLQLDSTSILYLNFDDNSIVVLCEWLKTNQMHTEPIITKYTFDLLKKPFTQIKKTRKYIESHISTIKKYYAEDDALRILHEQSKIKSLIWYPFGFEENNYYLLALNQISEERQWTQIEISFIESFTKQLRIALMKIKINTEHKLLKESEFHLKGLYNNISDAIFYQEMKTGNIISVNQTATRIYGYSNEEFKGMKIINFDDKTNDAEIKSRIELLSNNEMIMFECIHKTKKGKYITVEIKSSKINDETFISAARDITDRKLAEQALKESEKLLYKTAQLADLGGWEYDLTTDKLSWSAQTYKIHEVANTFVPTIEKAINFYHIDDRTIISDAVTRAIELGQAFDVQLRLITAKQKLLWVRAIGEAIALDGKVVKVNGTFQNITKQKNTEFSLQKQQQLLSETEQIGNVGGWEINIDTLEQTWTKETYNIHEVDNSFKPNVNNGLNFYTHTSKIIIEDLVNKAITKSEPFDVELDIITAKGNIRYVHAIGKTDMKNRRVYGFFQDITRRKLAEKALKESETKFKEIIEQITDGIIIFDNKGKIIIWNSGAVMQTGVKPIEAINENIVDVQYKILHGKFKNRDFIQQKFNEIVTLSNPKTFNKIFDNEIFIHEKGIRTIQGIVFSIKMNAEYYLFGTTIRDITELKLIENQLRALNTTKDKFLTILAHDLKTPFQSILGFSDLLAKNLYDYNTDEIHTQVKIIQRTSQLTYFLLEELLLWAKSQTGKIPFEPQKIYFSEICYETINHLKESANAKQITINYFEIEKIYLNADFNMLKAILRNLISNAIKFTHKKGKINITIDKFENSKTENLNDFQAKELPNFQVITISDNGVGIDETAISEIWEISTQYSTTGTANEKGTGLGLILCKEFVEKHGGKIWVESEIGKGSDFKFTIPLY